MEKKYLPIGSVCTLKGKNKKIMITGYYSIEFNGNFKIKDYFGCVFPEGMLLADQVSSFNHDDIESIDFLGYENDEQKRFSVLMDQITDNDKTSVEKVKDFHEKNDMFLASNSSYSKLLFDENGVVMIAEPVKDDKKETTKSGYKFDENGVVISAKTDIEVENPFHKDYSFNQNNNIPTGSIDEIFNKKDYNSVDLLSNDKKKDLMNKIEFDENGVVISVTGESLKNKDSYKFDENGVVILEDK